MKFPSTAIAILLTVGLFIYPSTGHTTPGPAARATPKPASPVNARNLMAVKTIAPPKSCPYYCYDPVNNTTSLHNWCKTQPFCGNTHSSNRNSYSRYQYCPSHCFHPNRDYYKMKEWCIARGVCSKSGGTSNSYLNPNYVLQRNYSLRNYYYQKVGRIIRFTLSNQGASNMTWTVSHMPSGATFNTTTLEFIWKPRSWHVGSSFVTFTVSDGKQSASKTIEFKIKEEWEAFFLPGLSYTTYIPNNTKMLGTYHGVSINYILLAWVHRNEKRGPSHGRVYFKLDIMQGTKEILDNKNKDANDMIYWAFGVDLSFERNPKRPFAIPFFGLELGGSYSARPYEDDNCSLSAGTCDNKLGGVFHITPTFGMHLWSDRNFFVTVSGGYSFAVQDSDNLRGWRVNAGVNFTFW
ncbi:hypothetical protein KKF84_16825 [Myxococcota bacterium]|nr:hypothetical protein [Myxococcota bacterium]MBU1536990.1 hypothetical protein [Myxococcota bacterium]